MTNDAECLIGDGYSDGGNLLVLIIGVICVGLVLYFFRYSCELCLGRELNQKRLSITLFLIFFPELILALVNLVFAFLKKNKIDDYLSMEFIDLFKNKNVNSIQDNLDRVIILLIVNVAIFVLYPILVIIANKLKGDDDYDTVKNNIETSLSEYNKY